MSEEKSTTIEIKTDKVEEGADTQLGQKSVWHKYQTLVGRKFKPHTSLDNLRDLSNTKIVDMKVNIDNHPYDIKLPDEMAVRLKDYLSDKDYPFDGGKFDCVSFVHRILGEKYKFGDGVDLEKYDMKKLDTDWDIKPGDVIHFSPANKWGSGMSAVHAAVYIGHGLYLSKLGENTGLAVQKLFQLQELYGKMGENNLFKQVPK